MDRTNKDRADEAIAILHQIAEFQGYTLDDEGAHICIIDFLCNVMHTGDVTPTEVMDAARIAEGHYTAELEDENEMRA